MLISICIITYNHELYIAQALDSVLMQICNYPIEIVVGEDCSTDKTREICEQYAEKHKNISVITSQKNVGMIQNFRRTSDACNGKYIAMLEGDDYWTDPYKLQKQVDFLESHPDFVLCFHDKAYLNEGEIIRSSTYSYTEDTYFEQEAVFEANILTVTVVFRNILKKHPLPKEFDDLPLYDFGSWAYLSMFGKCAYLNFNGAIYRIHSSSVFSSNDPISNYQKMIFLFKKLSVLFPLNYQKKFNYYTLLTYFMLTEELRVRKIFTQYYFYLPILIYKSKRYEIYEFTNFYISHYKTKIKHFIKSLIYVIKAPLS